MKRLLLILTGFITINTFGQAFLCGTQYEPSNNNLSPISPSSNISSNPSNPFDVYVIDVFFHLVRDTTTPTENLENYYGLNYGEPQILEVIKYLNIHFSSHRIYFKYNGYDIVKNSLINGTTSAGAPSFSSFIPFMEPNHLNLFFVENLGGYGGLAYIGNTHARFSYFHLENGGFYHSIIHEVGHCLNLLHIHQNANSDDGEHVTRITTDPNYNATFAGDYIHDTPAQGLMGNNEFDESCTYIPNPLNADYQGTPYENVIPDNFMGYDSDPNCNPHFTEGQYQRMRDYLSNNPFNGQNIFGSVDSLYQPFFIGGGTSGTGSNGSTAYSKTYTPNESNTGVNVWNCGPFKLRYQPGINYEFSNLPGTVIVDEYEQFDAVSSNLYIEVTIPALDRKDRDIPLPVCFGTFEPYTSGDVKSTTNLGSTYYTIEELDEIKASDPNLYQQLQSQQYHIITKETDNGYVDQKLIYKN